MLDITVWKSCRGRLPTQTSQSFMAASPGSTIEATASIWPSQWCIWCLPSVMSMTNLGPRRFETFCIASSAFGTSWIRIPWPRRCLKRLEDDQWDFAKTFLVFPRWSYSTRTWASSGLSLLKSKPTMSSSYPLKRWRSWTPKVLPFKYLCQAATWDRLKEFKCDSYHLSELQTWLEPVLVAWVGLAIARVRSFHRQIPFCSIFTAVDSCPRHPSHICHTWNVGADLLECQFSALITPWLLRLRFQELVKKCSSPTVGCETTSSRGDNWIQLRFPKVTISFLDLWGQLATKSLLAVTRLGVICQLDWCFNASNTLCQSQMSSLECIRPFCAKCILRHLDLFAWWTRLSCLVTSSDASMLMPRVTTNKRVRGLSTMVSFFSL